MQIIIAGAGKVGAAVASQLAREGHDVAVIDNNEYALNDVLAAVDVSTFFGNCINPDILREAQADQADLFIALTGDDGNNLFGCLLARQLGAKNTIARVRRTEYTKMLPLISEDLHLSMAVNPEKEAAMEIARILALPLANKVETFAKGRVEMIDYALESGSPICGKRVKDVFFNMKSALVCAVERGEEVFIPLGDFLFEEGDVLTVIAPAGRMWEFFRVVGGKQQAVKKVIISGGGRTSYYLAEQLLSQHMRVTIFEKDEAVARELAELLPQAVICHGDGTSQSVLMEEGLAEADAFCCLTGIDEENIITALAAKYEAPQLKTVVKVNRSELIPVTKPLGVGSVVSPKMMVSDRVVGYVRAIQRGVGSGVLTLYQVVDNKAEAIEFKVSADSQLTGVPIRQLKLKDNIILACINRGGSIISPRGDDCLLAGDTVIVVTTHTGFDVLDDIIRG